MLRSAPTGRIAKFVLLLSTLAFAAPGCSDTRTPFAAYLECDDAIANATDTRDVFSCYTEYQLDVLSLEAQDDDAWLARFQSSRPIIKRLHEEQLQDVADESILLIVGHTKFGQPVATTVLMHRDGGRWKIAKEDSLAKGAGQDDVRPVKAALQREDGQAWYPGELAASIRNRPGGKCQLSIAHVFRAPEILVTTACEAFSITGAIPFEKLALDNAEGSGSFPVRFHDHRGTWFDRVEDGELRITEVANGVISGEFNFDVASAYDSLSITGSFTNLPFDQGS